MSEEKSTAEKIFPEAETIAQIWEDYWKASAQETFEKAVANARGDRDEAFAQIKEVHKKTLEQVLVFRKEAKAKAEKAKDLSQAQARRL